jgi:hypothetical protein
VWTWVAYEDDPARGKDRPVLVVGAGGMFCADTVESARAAG